MTSPKPVLAPAESRGIKLHWTETPGLSQVLADEAIVQFTGDRVYVTVGQVQLPPIATPEEAPSFLDVAPIARLVFTTEAFHKIANTMKGVSEQIKKGVK